MRHQKGFAILESIVVIVAVLVVGAAVWNVWHIESRKSVADASSGQSSPTSSDPHAGWLTYADPVGGFSVKYPNNWAISTRQEGDGKDEHIFTKLISPGQVVLNVSSIDGGGRGGACIPAATDKPFQADNECPSFEYMSAEALPVDGLYQMRYKSNYEPDGAAKATLYVTTTHYAKADASEPTYAIGLTASSAGPPAIRQPAMGPILFTHPIMSRTSQQGAVLPALEIYAAGSSPAFLESPEAATIKDILRTFTIQPGSRN